MLVWAKKVPEDGERGKTEYQHAVQGINQTAVLPSPTRPSRNGCWFLEMRLMSILLYGTLFTSSKLSQSTRAKYEVRCFSIGML